MTWRSPSLLALSLVGFTAMPATGQTFDCGFDQYCLPDGSCTAISVGQRVVLTGVAIGIDEVLQGDDADLGWYAATITARPDGLRVVFFPPGSAMTYDIGDDGRAVVFDGRPGGPFMSVGTCERTSP